MATGVAGIGAGVATGVVAGFEKNAISHARNLFILFAFQGCAVGFLVVAKRGGRVFTVGILSCSVLGSLRWGHVAPLHSLGRGLRRALLQIPRLL